jgi:hypothetical protein
MTRLILVNSDLTSTLTYLYFSTSFDLMPWAIKKIDILRRKKLWSRDNEVRGGHCLVNWKSVCSPNFFGGLGVKGLCSYGRALRLCWLWYSWDEVERP